MPHRIAAALLITLLLCCAASSAVAQPLVATSEPLTPAEQLKKFKLPPGFEIQYIAGEPDVHKPMNLKFDPSGRLWLSHSLEYPFAAKDPAKARDAITIFSQFGADGKAGKIERFAEGLNIPIGILPLNERTVLVWSIPNIWRLEDTDGDGKADKKTIAYGPFGINDTHGNQNSFNRWLDGWVYSNHGFANTSKVKIGGEGPEVMSLNSGNTYRFRADGSQIEQFSWGQVNPFGACFDPLGNLFSADCHSKPVTMNLREGYYQSFGKPHDGLGYAPEATDIDHGGTGIAGMVYYSAHHFPPEYRDVLFVGNVIKTRIHCDRLKWNGSSPKVAKVEDFLTCDDPWFRPVDIQMGPDGALYIADFYNCIIGHYEVPLTHPKRDRERGRLWRVVYRGTNEKDKTAPISAPNIAAADEDGLFKLLAHDNQMVRTAAVNALVDRFPKTAGEKAKSLLAQKTTTETEQIRTCALWLVNRLVKLDEKTTDKLAGDPSRQVRTHLAIALGEASDWRPWTFNLVRKLLTDADPFVRRAAGSALAKHPNMENVAPLVAAWDAADKKDDTLVHALRIAVRDQLRDPDVAQKLAGMKLDEKLEAKVMSIAAATSTGPAAVFIFNQAKKGNVSADLLMKSLPSVARYIGSEQVDELIDFAKKKFEKDPNFQIGLLRGMADGLTQRGSKPTPLMVSTATELLKPVIRGDRKQLWQSDKPLPESPWGVEDRKYQDGKEGAPLITSLRERGPAGEKRTGVLRSPPFIAPVTMQFWMCGHNGDPKGADKKQNYIRLVQMDGTEIARTYPSRSDIAVRHQWDLAPHAGKQVVIEIVDGCKDEAYAWLAVSRFDPLLVNVPKSIDSEVSGLRGDALRLARVLKIEALSDDVATCLGDAQTDLNLRLAAGDTLAVLKPTAAVAPLVSIVTDAGLPTASRQRACELLGQLRQKEGFDALLAALRNAPQPVAVSIATALAEDPKSAVSLLTEIRIGKASATLLREATVLAKLKQAGIVDLDKQVKELTAKLSPDDDRVLKLIKSRRDSYLVGKFSPEIGKQVFAKSVCINCHKVGEVGKNLAPSLDGIGVRGVERLLEDLLDPSRNVDQSFRQTTIETEGGQILTGFGLREEDKSLVYNDTQGQLQRIPLADVAARHVTPLSPMPANISEAIKEEDFNQLLAYLLSLKSK